MRVRALVVRILRQFWHDKRTIALMVVAPLLIMWLVSLVFNGGTNKPKIGLVDVPVAFTQNLAKENVTLTPYLTRADALNDLKKQKLDAFIDLHNGRPDVELEGSDPSKNKQILLDIQQLSQVQAGAATQTGRRAQAASGAAQAASGAVQAASGAVQAASGAVQAASGAVQAASGPPLVQPTVEYLYGSAGMTSFDNFGPVLIGVFAFFFVFLVAGISFLKERTSGTLERLVASPLKRWEIVTGYVVGFGIFTMIQAALMAWFAVDVLGMMMTGRFINLLIITLLLSMTALTLGIFLSSFANSEFQMMQFIPIVIVPQIFFSGLFNIDTMANWLRWLSHIIPLYYGADALRNVMIRGKGFASIEGDCVFLLSLSILFMVLNVISLRKYRAV